MKDRRFSVPEQKNYELAYAFAFDIASKKLAEIKDIEEQCRKSGTEYRATQSGGEVIINYMGRPYKITLQGVKISPPDSDEEAPMREKVLILHYFLSAKGTALTNNLITFRELPEGKVYLPTFNKRTTYPLVKYFGENPLLLVEAAEKMGGSKADYGDAAVTFDAFRYVPVTIVMWKGDDEFPPEGNILFDSTVTDYLSTEDTIVLCETITWKLVRLLREA